MELKPNAIIVTDITRPKYFGSARSIRFTLFSIWKPLEEAPTNDAAPSAAQKPGAMASSASEAAMQAPKKSITAGAFSSRREASTSVTTMPPMAVAP